jgi:hypothetical protein
MSGRFICCPNVAHPADAKRHGANQCGGERIRIEFITAFDATP